MLSIFISHSHAESALSKLIEEELKKDFGEGIYVYNSSNRNPTGEDFIDNIKSNLKKCRFGIFIVGPDTLCNRWINIEYGAIAMRNLLLPRSKIPTVPLCHSSLRPENLPKPLDSVGAIVASNEQGLELLFNKIGDKLNSQNPISNKADLATEIARFELEYLSNIERNKSVQEIHHVNLAVRDLKRSVDFYCDTLGLCLIKRPRFDFDGVWFGLPNGQHLHLVESRGLEEVNYKLPIVGDTETPPDSHFAFWVSPEKFNDCVRKALRDEAVGPQRCVVQPFDIPILQFYLLDPTGYLVEITSIGDADKFPGYIRRHEWEHYAYRRNEQKYLSKD